MPRETAPVATPKIANFDFYLLTLSWSPTHCSSDEGRGRDDDLQCRAGRPFGFVLHGLWPQNERGYPESCETSEPRRLGAEALDIALKLSPSEKLVQHEWEKHGTCSGLTQEGYYAAAARAVGSIAVPKPFVQPAEAIRTSPADVRRAFLSANPGIGADGIAVTCRGNDIGEVRVCLDKDLNPRACSRDVLKRQCRASNARMLAVRGDWPR
jgi:ribonuclease T2